MGNQMTTAIQLADWLVAYRVGAGVPIDPMSLEKHLFYAQAFHLATKRRALFADDFQAWVKGPVIRDVWERYNGQSQIVEPVDDPPTLSRDIEEFITEVAAFCGPMQPMELSLATHAEKPWVQARQGFESWEACSVVIPRDEIRKFYASIIDDGENALSAYGLLDSVPEPRFAWLYVAGVYSNRMTKHPFYVEGARVWKEKLWEPPIAAKKYPKGFFKAPRMADDDGPPITSLADLRRELAH